MRLYLDNCCFNRPYDEQVQIRVRIETEAKLELQQWVVDAKAELAWSYMLDFENSANPNDERRDAIAAWKSRAVVDVFETIEVLRLANEALATGLRAKDTLHVACAIYADCDFFVTTDDQILKKLQNFSHMSVVNPVNPIIEVD